MKNVCLFLIVFSLCQQPFGNPISKSAINKCYNYDCPDGTYSCKKHTKVDNEKKYLDTTISCLDVNKNVRAVFAEKDRNPYGPGVFYDSYSYSSIYTFDPHPNLYNKDNVIVYHN